MDERDYDILAQLMRTPTASFEDLARSLGVTRNAVARRVRLLQRSPLHVAFYGLPHFTLFNRTSFVFLFHPKVPPDGSMLLDSDDVLGYDVNHDGLVAVTLWPAGTMKDPSPPPSLVKALGQPVARFKDATPGPRAPYLSRLEWNVVRALIQEPRATAVRLSKLTGLAARTCARARRRLLEGKYMQVGLTLLEDRSGGFPVYRVYVQGQPSSGAVLRILGPSALVTDSVEEGRVYMAKAASTGAIVTTVDRLRKVPDVDDVKLILSHDNRLAAAWLEELCDEQRSRLGSSKAGPSPSV